MLNVVMPIVVYAECHKLALFAECCDAEYGYTECCYAQCRYGECCYAECYKLALYV
jgi:hypothetical protein